MANQTMAADIVNKMTTKVEKMGIALQYNWKLIHKCDVRWDVMPSVTYLSAMIKYRGLESFRFGLKNHQSPVLFFMAANLQEMGCRVSQVILRNGSERSQLMLLVNGGMDESPNCQLFTTNLPVSNLIATGHIFSFKIYLTVVEGLSENFQFHLVPRYPILSSSRHHPDSADFELIAADAKKFPIHKQMLAARSCTFASLFVEDPALKQQAIEWVTSPCLEKFIHFIYTGEISESAKSSELLKLAQFYKIKTLETLCQYAASSVVAVEHLTPLALYLTQDAYRPEHPLVTIDSKEKNPEIDFLSSPMILRCTWTVDSWTEDSSTEKAATSNPFIFNNQKISQARVKIDRSPIKDSVKFTLLLGCYIQEKLECWRVAEVSYTCSSIPTNDTRWNSKLQPQLKPLQPTKGPLQMFIDTYELSTGIDSFPIPFTISFDLSLDSTDKNSNSHCLVDSTWRNQLWDAAINKTLTDIDFKVGDETISAHRFVLSAWCPSKQVISTTTQRTNSEVTLDYSYASSSTLRHLLKFIYTGTLESLSSVEKEELYAAAANWDLKQLMKLCRPNSDAAEIWSLMEAFASF